MIRLSASSIKDFLKCSKMYYFRSNFSEEAVETNEMIEGTIVHKILEIQPACDVGEDLDSPFWHTVKAMVRKEVSLYNNQDLDIEKIEDCLMNFYIMDVYEELRRMFSTQDKTELYFRLPVEKNIEISGKMDRVFTNQNIVLDYKTGTTKKYINNDIQYILYYWAYKQMFGTFPTVYQVSLSKATLERFYPEEKYITSLFDEVIPAIADQIKKGRYYREGYYTGACFRCNFIGLCNRPEQEL